MSSGGLQRSVILSAIILLRAVTGFSGDGRTIWSKNPNFSPVNESQLFLYDTFPKNFFWGVGTGAFQVEGNWKAPSSFVLHVVRFSKAVMECIEL